MGGGPTNARFLQLFPFFRFFVFVCLFFISSDANICLFVCLRVVVVVIILFFKNKSHLVLFFCRHRHQGRG